MSSAHTLSVDIHKPLWSPWLKKSLHALSNQRECVWGLSERIHLCMLYYASMDWPITSFSLSLAFCLSFPSLRLWPGTSSILNISHQGQSGWMNYKSARYINRTHFICEQIASIFAFWICKCLSIINVMSLPLQETVWMSHMYRAAIFA